VFSPHLSDRLSRTARADIIDRTVFSRLSQKLLPLLQLTRMALVFTAIADAASTLLLLYEFRGTVGVPWHLLAVVAGVSVGLYGFGMSLNDIIDRRRDSMMAPHRPLPSARLGVTTAHLVCGGLFTLAVTCAVVYAKLTGQWLSLGLTVWTAALIYFYDVAGKYLVAPGLLSLGLIRFFHALVPGPEMPVVWHPLTLLTHVAILSAVAYHLEEKRPALTRWHWYTVVGGVLLTNAVVLGVVGHHRAELLGGWRAGLAITSGLVYPVCAVLAFVAVAYVVVRRSATSRAAGQTVMLYGLLWLIVYDASFVAAYAGWVKALGVLALLPVAYMSVQLVRWWSAVVAISQRPAFKRVEV
jgi:hypothetical protein